ncbi:ATP-dependent helicase [Deferrisoma sp.]
MTHPPAFDPEAIRSQLNPAQWEAVSHGEGPLLILAGAGSGKTRVLTYRIAYLIGAAGVSPREILAVTFTNKAAREMLRRVEALLGSRSAGIWIGTFHGVCLRILRAHGHLLPVGPEFTIYDADDQRRLAKAVVDELGLDGRRTAPGALLHRVQRLKDDGIPPERLPPETDRTLRDFYERYQGRLREARAMDFGDLLLETLLLFERHPDLADHYRRRFRHILIDEFQDTNRVQYLLARHLAALHGNLCVVGDDDQSIYSWRGADLRNILAFEQDFPGARVVKLEQNYRSTQVILDAAWSVVSRNRHRHPKRLWTDRGEGEPLVVHEARTEEDEAAWVADTIGELRRQGMPLGEIAVLYRVHALSRPLEEALLTRGIPYVVYGGLRFYDRREVKDALAYLRLVVNPDDPLAFRRVVNVPPRGIGRATLEVVEALAREEGIGLYEAARRAVAEGRLKTRQARSLAGFLGLLDGWREIHAAVPLRELLLRILEDSGYLEALAKEDPREAQERRENLQELLNAAEAFERDEGGGAKAFLDRAALVSDQDLGPDRAEAVTLMTLHAAKGLEYRVVFLTGLEEGTLPHQLSIWEDGDVEEERRLCYVGMTRAKDRLFLSRARIRRVYGRDEGLRDPSRFLGELPPGAFRRVEPEPAAPSYGDESPDRLPGETADDGGLYLQPEPGAVTFRPGMRVRHPAYGAGRILRVQGRGPATKLVVQFAESTRKLLAWVSDIEIAAEDLR